MTESEAQDMAPFLRRHDRKSFWTSVVMFATSLVLSATIFADAMALVGSAGVVVRDLWNQIVMGPLVIGSLWIASTWLVRKRPPAVDEQFAMNGDDARNLERVANAGYVFMTGFGLVMIAGQAYWLLVAFGVMQAPEGRPSEWWVVRALMVAIAALMLHFGNVGPRMPTSRAPEAKPAVRMKYNRLTGWMYVVFGVLLSLAALFAPGDKLIDAIGGLGLLILVVILAGAMLYQREMKTPAG